MVQEASCAPFSRKEARENSPEKMYVGFRLAVGSLTSGCSVAKRAAMSFPGAIKFFICDEVGSVTK
jgi:hypothetical protein